MLKKNDTQHSNWLPDFFAQSVLDIDFVYLKNQGIRAVMFDLDHTILRHGMVVVDKDNIRTLRESGMDVYIATNRRESTALDGIKNAIGAKGIMFAQSVIVSKPNKEYYRLAAEMTGLSLNEVAMVGDRLVQDIWGANRAGLTTIMVSKFGNIKWFDQLPTVLDRALPKMFNKSYKENDKQ